MLCCVSGPMGAAQFFGDDKHAVGSRAKVKREREKENIWSHWRSALHGAQHKKQKHTHTPDQPPQKQAVGGNTHDNEPQGPNQSRATRSNANANTNTH